MQLVSGGKDLCREVIVFKRVADDKLLLGRPRRDPDRCLELPSRQLRRSREDTLNAGIVVGHLVNLFSERHESNTRTVALVKKEMA
jgi:hypothetical protein